MTDEIAKLHLPQCVQRNESYPPPEAYSSSMVAVVVGKEDKQKTFNIYKDVLTFYSSYFRNALKDVWVEGQTKTINLVDDDPEVFQIFSYWLFSKRLYHPDSVSQSSNEKDIPLTSRRICEVYVIGDIRGVPELCNIALDILYAKMMAQWAIPIGDLHYVYDNTPKGSSLQRLLLDTFTKWGSLHILKTDASYFPKDFLIDFILKAEEKQEVPGSRYSSKEKDARIADIMASFCEKYHTH